MTLLAGPTVLITGALGRAPLVECEEQLRVNAAASRDACRAPK